jgi:hypothetical protein
MISRLALPSQQPASPFNGNTFRVRTATSRNRRSETLVGVDGVVRRPPAYPQPYNAKSSRRKSYLSGPNGGGTRHFVRERTRHGTDSRITGAIGGGRHKKKSGTLQNRFAPKNRCERYTTQRMRTRIYPITMKKRIVSVSDALLCPLRGKFEHCVKDRC